MRIAELSRLSGVSAASIKYYTREGLLAAGERSGYNQTDYDDTHLERLRLIRALLETGGISISTARDVLGAIDDPDLPLGAVLGSAQYALPRAADEPDADAHARVAELIGRRGWAVHPGNPGLASVAGVLAAYDRLGRSDLVSVLDRFADAAEIVAEADLDAVAAAEGRDRQAETVVVGTLLGDVLFAGLRRLAQESAALARYSTGGAALPTDPTGSGSDDLVTTRRAAVTEEEQT